MIIIDFGLTSARIHNPAELVNEPITSGTVGRKILLRFSPAWDGLSRVAVFSAGSVTRDVLIEGSERQALVEIPGDVLLEPRCHLRMGVFGHAGGATQIPTVYCSLGQIKPGADPYDDPSTDPTLPVWGQLQEELNAQGERLTTAEGDIDNLEERVTTAEDDIDNLEERVTTAEDDIDNLEERVTTAEGDIDNLEERVTTAEDDIAGIKARIPAQASAANQLADKDFVNSSISTNTANYISDNGQPFASLAALQDYSGPLTNNDYAFVIGTDSAGNAEYTRYKYVASTRSWAEEYKLNNSSFTAAQWAAISSGITALGVAQIESNRQAIIAINNALAAKMEFYRVTLQDDPIYKFIGPDGEPLTYADLKALYYDAKYFLYAEYQSLTYIPSFPPEYDPAYDSEALEFATTYKYMGTVNYSRIIINEDNDIKAEFEVLATFDDLRNYRTAAAQDIIDNQIKQGQTRLKEDLAFAQADLATQKKINAAQQRDIDNLKAAAAGYLYRAEEDSTEAYSKAVPADALPHASLDMIGGKSIVMNQLQANTLSRIHNGVKFEWDNGTLTVSEVGTRSGAAFWLTSTNIKWDWIANHKYYIRGIGGNRIWYHPSSNTYFTGENVMFVPNENYNTYLQLQITLALDLSTQLVFKPQVFDLTAMFGAGNEPTGEQFEAMFPDDYYPYNEGEIISADVDSVIVAGKNLWDEKWRNGYFDQEGEFYSHPNRWATVNPIKVTPNTNYYYQCADYNGKRFYFYDKDMRFVYNLNASYNGVFTTPDNAYYMHFYTAVPAYSGSGTMVSLGNTSKPYASYREPIVKPVPAAIRNLPGYGKTGSLVDFDHKLYISPDGTTTDISDLISDGFEDIEVEGGGSITFHQVEHELPVPNKETYLIKLRGNS